jgi:iron complex outermembrane receptor protein
VTSGGTATVDLGISPTVIQLDQVIVSASKRPEKQDRCASVSSVVPEVQVTERPTHGDGHLKGLAGVDISQGGLVQSNVVGRGFNNIFSGATLMLIDNRFASVPSLRVNVPAFFPAANEDIEKIEFVLGPGAALYGPTRPRACSPSRPARRFRRPVPRSGLKADSAVTRASPTGPPSMAAPAWCGRPHGRRSG